MKQKFKLCKIILLNMFKEVFAFVLHVTLSIIIARVTAIYFPSRNHTVWENDKTFVYASWGWLNFRGSEAIVL
jgi:hypothetical protein